jgi:hypothetical protein
MFKFCYISFNVLGDVMVIVLDIGPTIRRPRAMDF